MMGKQQILSIFGVMLFALMLHHPVAAQATAGDVKKEFDQAFYAMLSDPADVDKTIRYTELAVKLGDYEAAIPPLERLLMLNPDLPEVKLEVGVLYYLLNSHEAAKGYLVDVAGDASATADQVERAKNYLSRM
jgi:tetratricopeptide (TPR) repeat protein